MPKPQKDMRLTPGQVNKATKALNDLEEFVVLWASTWAVATDQQRLAMQSEHAPLFNRFKALAERFK